MELIDIYKNSNNPMDDEKIIEKLINLWKKSNRTGYKFSTTIDCENRPSMYGLLSKAEQMDNSAYNMKDRDCFLVELYNTWIHNILSLNDFQKSIVSKNYYNLDMLIEKFKSIGEVKDYNDVMQISNNPKNYRSDSDVEYTGANGAFDYISSSKVSGYVNNLGDVKHRIYIGAKCQDIYKLAHEFWKECTNRNIPYEFKFDRVFQNRKDTIIIYSDDENFATYMEILDSIKQKYPDIVARCDKPSDIVSNVFGWLGVADEPNRIYAIDGKLDNPSYTQSRAVIIEEAMDKTVVQEIVKNINNDEILEYKGKQATIFVWLKQALFNAIKEEISDSNLHPLLANKYTELSDLKKNVIDNYVHNYVHDLSNKELCNMIRYFEDFAESRWQQDKSLICETPVFDNEFKLNIDKKYKPMRCKISLGTLDKMMKNMMYVLENNNPKITMSFRENLDIVAKEHYIDSSKFSFNIGTKEWMFKEYISSTNKDISKQVNDMMGDEYSK